MVTYCAVMACWEQAVRPAPYQDAPDRRGATEVDLCQVHLDEATAWGLALDWGHQLVCCVCWGRPGPEPCEAPVHQ